MSSVLHQFPAIARSGHQETAFVQIPVGMQSLQLTGQAAAAVLSDPTNGIVFTLYVSPDGTVGTRSPLRIDYWWGNTYVDKFPPHNVIPSVIDVVWGPMEPFVGQFVQLAVDFSQPMVVGATVTSLP